MLYGVYNGFQTPGATFTNTVRGWGWGWVGWGVGGGGGGGGGVGVGGDGGGGGGYAVFLCVATWKGHLKNIRENAENVIDN